MIRNVVAPSIIALIACGGRKSDVPAPVFTPKVANALRAIAPECKLEKTATSQKRDCSGRVGNVAIALGEADRFSSLVIALRPMVLFEAKNYLGGPLEAVLGAPGRDQTLSVLSKLSTGQSDQTEINGARILIEAGGDSKIAPAYTITINW